MISKLPKFCQSKFSQLMADINFSTYTIHEIKLFHGQNIALILYTDNHFDILTIGIYHINAHQIHHIFGLFTDMASATTKFNSINL